jgi:hypothetical protein
MTTSQFWQLIATARDQARNTTDHYKAVRAALEGMHEKEILSFEQHLRSNLRRAYTFDLMAAAFIIMSYASDDTFEDFRAWLIAQGRERFEKAIVAPESVAQYLTRDAVEEISGEGLLEAAHSAYITKTTRDDFFDKIEVPENPKIEMNWPKSREDFRRRYPALYDAFWNQERIAQLHKPQR